MKKFVKPGLWALFVVIYMFNLAQAGDYLWPIKITPKLSSQFGDYRSGHFHAGIDITTRGKPGYKVYAIGDGYVYRIKRSFWGYGNALYLKLKDGRCAVYGHLARFDHKIEEYVWQQQVKSKQYYQDLIFTPDQFPVKKGDYIALSGQSGAGAPHLHLELRESNNILVNPLKEFYNYVDNTPPVLDYLAIKRFNNLGLSNFHEIEFLPVVKNESGWAVADTIAIYGQVAFSLAGYDPNHSYNYGIYGVDMTLDDNRIFSIRNDQLDYATGRQIDYVRDYSLKLLCEEHKGIKNDNDKNVFYKLYIQPHDDQLFYEGYGYPAGVIFADSLYNGSHRLEIVLTDINNNSSTITANLKKAELAKPVIEAMDIHGDTLIIKTPELNEHRILEIQSRRNIVSAYTTVSANYDLFGDEVFLPVKNGHTQYRLRTVDDELGVSPWVEFDISCNSENVTAYADLLDITIYNDEPILANKTPLENFYTLPLPNGLNRTMIPLPVRNGYFALDLKDESNEHSYYKFNSGGYAYSPDSTIRMQIDESSLYDPAVLRITQPEIVNGSYVFKILPQDVLFKNPVLIEIDYARLGIDPGQASLYYYWRPKDKWVFIGADKAGAIEGETGGGGKFGILTDKNAPYIGSISPRNRRTISDGTPYLSCKVEDQLAGISKESQLVMTIDNIWVPAYYDIDTKEFGYQVKNPLRKTTHTLRIIAIDNQGNKSVKVSTFTIK